MKDHKASRPETSPPQRAVVWNSLNSPLRSTLPKSSSSQKRDEKGLDTERDVGVETPSEKVLGREIGVDAGVGRDAVRRFVSENVRSRNWNGLSGHIPTRRRDTRRLSTRAHPPTCADL